MNRTARLSIALVPALLLAFLQAPTMSAQGSCSRGAAAQTPMPKFAWTLPGNADMSTAYGANNLYVLTDWGFARAPIGGSAAGNPSPYSQIIIGNEGGSNNGGLIPIKCDCHQGSNVLDVAEAPDGTSRMILDWESYEQGGPPGGDKFSGLPAMVAMTSGAGPIVFGQQINLPNSVVLGGRVAAIYIPTTGKYFGYFPVVNQGVYLADITNPSGSLLWQNAIQPTSAIAWDSGGGSTSAVRLRAFHASVNGYDKYLLIGTTSTDDTLHVAEINTSTGALSEVANINYTGSSGQLEMTVVNGQIYIFNAALSSGLDVFLYNGPSHTLTPISIPNNPITGSIKRVWITGSGLFPVMFLYRDAGGGNSYVDVYDTKWLSDGGSPALALSLQHSGASDAAYRGTGFGAYVSSETAYLYRELNAPPPGVPTNEQIMHTDTLNIGCITADPNAPPVPFATMTNLSAAGRPSPENTKNYFGDKWQISDASVSFLPILELDWDFHNTGAFAAEKIVTGTDVGGWTYNPAYWPCDALAGGDIVSGTGCYASLGAPVSNYQLALRAKNANPPDTQTFTSASYLLNQPQISIVGFDGTTLSVLAGNPNNGDASISQGNVTDATFNWTFTPSGSAAGAVVTVPSNATAFALTATYKGGYTTSKNGGIQQVDLVPNFSATPNPVLKSANLTLKNLMQKAAAATLNSVTYSVNSNPPMNGTLNASFNAVNGTAIVTAPATVGNYTMSLVYNYTDHLGQARTAPTSQPFSVTDWAPNPFLGVYTDNGRQHSILPVGGVYGLTTGTTYYLFDDETVPNGVTYPGASFYKGSDANPSIGSGDTLLGTTSNSGPQTFPGVASCSGNCYIKVVVAGVVKAFKYSAQSGSGGGGCPPNCGGPPPPTLTLAGPATGPIGAPVTFTATASNFPGQVTYNWDFGDGGSGGGGGTGGGGGGGGGGNCPPIIPNCTQGIMILESLTPGPATNTHTYTAAGTYTVTAQAVSGSTTKTATRSITISQGGPPKPLNLFDILGATLNGFTGTWEASANVPISFTAQETDPGATFAWDFGDGGTAVGRSVSHMFTSAGIRTTVLTVTGGGTQTVGVSVGQAKFSISPPSFQAVMIPGAGSILAPGGNWATDISVTNPSLDATTVTLYFAAFTDTIPDDLSTLPFDSRQSFLLEAGQSWSGVDVIGSPSILNRPGSGKGLLLLKFSGAAPPIVTARVYFTANGASFGTALPSYLVGPFGAQNVVQGTQEASDQILIGLRDDSLYRFNISLFNASSEFGAFHLDVLTEQGETVASKDYGVPAYSQAGVQDTDVFTPDPQKRYLLKVTSSSGALQAFASALDRRNSDLVQVADDTPRIAAAPGDTLDYYISGVGRIEDEASNTHWRTDLRFYNSSAEAADLAFEYHYMPTGATIEKVVLASLHLNPGQGQSIDDFVGTFLNSNSNTDVDLTVGSILGVLHITLTAPTDIATAPLILGGRIYADLATGTAGMQLSTYSNAQTVGAGRGVLVMPGAQTNLRFRTNIGLFAASSLPTLARITAVRQDGTIASTFDWLLNDPGKTGAFVQVPMTALTGIDGNPTTIQVQSIAGGAVGAYIVTVDQISADTMFVQGRQGS